MMQHNWYLCLQLRNTIRFVMDLGTRPKRSKNKYFFFFYLLYLSPMNITILEVIFITYNIIGEC